MDKALDLHILRYVLSDLLDLLKRKLPGGHHPLSALFPPEIVGSIVGVVGLGADVSLDLRADFFGYLKDCRISNDEGIRFHFPKFLKVRPHTGKVVIVGQDIGCHMHPHAVLVGESDSLRHVLSGKVFRLCPQAKGLTAYIHCVRAEDHCCLQHLQAAGRDEQFRMSVHNVFPFFTLTASPSPRGRMLVNSRSSCFS